MTKDEKHPGVVWLEHQHLDLTSRIAWLKRHVGDELARARLDIEEKISRLREDLNRLDATAVDTKHLPELEEKLANTAALLKLARENKTVAEAVYLHQGIAKTMRER